MAKRMTDEQKLAVDTVDRAVIVSANAGSGKTSTMIERLITLINQHKCSVSEILALTFTKSASVEMRQRMFKAIEESSVLSIEEKHYEFSELNVADMCSLDSFCQKIIKKYFYVYGIDPNFAVIDEVESGYLKSIALEDAINKLCNSPKFLDLAQAMSATKNYSNIEKAVYAFSNFLSSLKDPQEYMNNKNIMDQYNKAVCYTIENFKKVVLFMKNYLATKLKYIDRNEFESLKPNTKLAYDFCCLFKKFDFKEMQNFLKFVEIGKFETKSKGKTVEEIECRRELSSFRTYYNTEMMTYARYFCFGNLTKLMTINEQSQKYIKTFYELTKEYLENYRKLKSDRGVLDFADLEDIAIRILAKENVKNEVQNKYKFVCVDEFQDINEKQSELLKLICRDDNTFFVGDPKQSIYKFRQCDLNIFVSLIDEFKKDNRKKFISFNQNFRSHKMILSFVNSLFSAVMTKECTGIDYAGENQFTHLKSVRLRIKNGFKNLRSRKINYVSRVCVYQLDNKKRKTSFDSNYILKSKQMAYRVGKAGVKSVDGCKKLCGKYKISIIDDIYSVIQDQNKRFETKKTTEGDVAVAYINEILGKKVCITDTKTKKKRRARFSDFVILVHDHSLFNDYIEKLSQANIPISAKLKLNLASLPCVTEIINILRVISNPFQDIHLAGCLKTVGHFNEEELYKISSQFVEDRFYKSYQRALYCNKDRDLQLKLTEFDNKIKKYRFLSRNFTVSELLQTIIDDCDLKNYLLSSVDGVNKLKQVELFLSKLEGKSFETSIDEFLHFIDSYQKAFEVDYSTVSSDNCVKITTIHDSKGLEFPIVIVGGCGKKFNEQNADFFVYTKEMGIGGMAVDLVERTKVQSISHNAILMSKRMDEFLENMRVYYVALTRAKEYLALIGTINQSKDNEKPLMDITDYKTVYDFMTFIKDMKNEFKQINLEVKTKKYVSNDQHIYGKGDTDYAEELVLNLDKGYKFAESTKLPLKNSVSVLLKKANDEQSFEENDFLTKSMYNNAVLEGTERGIAYHTAMQCLDYDSEENFLSRVHFALTDLQMQAVEQEKLLKCREQILSLSQKYGNGKMYKEKKFMMYIPYNEIFLDSKVEDSLLVQGIVDLFIECSETILLVDYKTNKIKDDEKLKKEYEMQMQLYAKSLKECFNKKVEGYLYSFSTQSLIKTICLE